jgi:hypothetical protein
LISAKFVYNGPLPDANCFPTICAHVESKGNLGVDQTGAIISGSVWLAIDPL